MWISRKRYQYNLEQQFENGNQSGQEIGQRIGYREGIEEMRKHVEIAYINIMENTRMNHAHE